jgi:MFS family permease
LFYAIFLLIGGVIADRFNRKKLMLASDLVRSTTQAIVAVLLFNNAISLWHFIVLQSIYATASAFFRPAVAGVIPQIVKKDELEKANALLNTFSNAANIIGPLFAGLLIASFSSSIIFLIDSLTFLVSAIFIYFTLIPSIKSVAKFSKSEFIKDFKIGGSEILKTRWIMIGILSRAVYHFFVLPALYVLGPIIIREKFGGAQTWVLVMVSLGVGGVVGSLLAMKVKPKRPMVFCMILLAIASTQPLVFLLSGNLIVMLFFFFILSLIVYLQYIVWISLLQKKVNADLISKVFSWDQLGYAAVLPVGMVLVGPLVEITGTSFILMLYSAIPVIFCMILAFVKETSEVKSFSKP